LLEAVYQYPLDWIANNIDLLATVSVSYLEEHKQNPHIVTLLEEATSVHDDPNYKIKYYQTAAVSRCAGMDSPSAASGEATVTDLDWSEEDVPTIHYD
jgi:hypothetical protein